VDLLISISDIERVIFDSGQLTVRNLEEVAIEEFRCVVPDESWFEFRGSPFIDLELKPLEERSFAVDLVSEDRSRPVLLTAEGYIKGERATKATNVRIESRAG
jgi:hypothetical protein